MAVDLSKCKRGDRLLTCHGMVMEYVGPLSEDNFYDHEVMYPDGSPGTRTNDGHVYRNPAIRLWCDHDIIRIL